MKLYKQKIPTGKNSKEKYEKEGGKFINIKFEKRSKFLLSIMIIYDNKKKMKL